MRRRIDAGARIARVSIMDMGQFRVMNMVEVVVAIIIIMGVIRGGVMMRMMFMEQLRVRIEIIV